MLAISRDSHWSHAAWQEVLEIDFPLISDWNGEATRGFGVAHESRGMKDVPLRTAFLVGGNGIIRGAWRYETPEVPDFDVLLAAARSLASGGS